MKIVYTIIKIGKKCRLNRIKFIRNIFDRLILFRVPFALKIQGVKIKKFPLRMYLKGVHEPATTNLVKKMIKPGMTVVDAGAHFGYYSLLFAKLVGPQGDVYAFEPDKTSFNILNNNIKLNNFDNVKTFNLALSNKKGKEKFYIYKKDLGINSLLPDVNKYKYYYSVDTDLLDNIIKEKSVDFTKIDVEGAELMVLEGMNKIIKNNRNFKIILELSPKIIRKTGYNLDNFFTNLLSKDLNFYDIDSEGILVKTDLNDLIKKAEANSHINIMCEKK